MLMRTVVVVVGIGAMMLLVGCAGAEEEDSQPINGESVVLDHQQRGANSDENDPCAAGSRGVGTSPSIHLQGVGTSPSSLDPPDTRTSPTDDPSKKRKTTTTICPAFFSNQTGE